ncbi:MAG TPA: hypothetical protein VHB02_12595 [Acidimicrobiales bacterium]|nr:hypothetical protein [Acidimicrobiales bacterium]
MTYGPTGRTGAAGMLEGDRDVERRRSGQRSRRVEPHPSPAAARRAP